MKEELIKKIIEIVEGEKLALDTYFFCGAGSAYIEGEQTGAHNEEAKLKLLECLEAAAAKGQEVLKARVLIDAEDPKTVVIKEILANRELL